MTNILEMFSYSFMIRALIVGILIAFCSSLIGVTLVLKKTSNLGDGLSHVGFGAFALATVFGFAPLEFAIPIVIIVSFLILKTNENSKINGDSKIALISASSLALGIFFISSFKGVNTDINSYLFGSILSISTTDLIISIVLSIIIIVLYILCYNKIFAITFDEKFAKSIGINTNFYNILFASLCSIVVVLGMRLMGSLLISSLLIFPTITAMQIFKHFKKVLIASVIISILSFIIGLIISYLLSYPTGATIVLVNLGIFIIFKMSTFFLKRIA